MDTEKILDQLEQDTSFSDSEIKSGAEFTKSVKKIIRKEFLKIGGVLLAILLSVLCFIQWGLSPIISSMYYNPGTETEYDAEISSSTNIMSRDISVYTELRFPLDRRDSVIVTDRGYGTYNISIPQTVRYYHEAQVDATGYIERGKLTLYNPSVFQPMPMNYLDYSYQNFGSPDYYDSMQQDFYNLMENTTSTEASKYVVVLKESLSVSQVNTLAKNYDWGLAWYGVEVANSDELGIAQQRGYMGYLNFFSGSLIPYDRENYPLLDGYKPENADLLLSESEALTHFSSMLKYLSEQKDFINMMDSENSTENYKGAYDYVTENGIKIYCAVIYADKETITAINGNENVLCISELW